DAFRAALRTLEGQARYGEFAPQPVKHRLAFEGDTFFPSKLILDLANSTGDILEITSQGWQITNNLKTAFRQSPSTQPLPIPNPAPGTPSPTPQPTQPPTRSLEPRPSLAHLRPPPHRPLSDPRPPRTHQQRKIRPCPRPAHSHRSQLRAHSSPSGARPRSLPA